MSEKLINITVIDKDHVQLKYQKYFWFIENGKPYTVDAYLHKYWWYTEKGKITSYTIENMINDTVDAWDFYQSRKK